MTANLNRLAEVLEKAAPDKQLEAQLRYERDMIEESLDSVGEYVLNGDDGRVYLITSIAKEPKS
jgi:hypothetical protein